MRVQEQNVQLDPAADSRRRQAAARAAEREEQEAQMDADEKLVLKQRVLQLLQPGESVLDALRRLAGRRAALPSCHPDLGPAVDVWIWAAWPAAVRS